MLLSFIAFAWSLMTMAGPLPIEQIEPGMMVWSAPECGTGQACYRPVLEAYRNRAPEVWHVSYDHDAAPATPDETLGVSAEHPFWVEETASFLPAADLRPGMTLRMSGGHGGTIGTIRHETSRSPAGTAVFNFAVAEHHTYFAGKGGVWVHNVCPEGLERLKGKYLELLESGTVTKDEAIKELSDWMAKDKTDGGFTEEDFQQTKEYLFSNAIDSEADHLLRSNPNSYLTHDQLVEQRARSGIDGRSLNSHHLLTKEYAHILNISDKGSIIAVPLTPKWHTGALSPTEIGKGVNIYARIQRALKRIGASVSNPTAGDLFKAHKEVYVSLGREDWAKAIYSKYFQPLGINY